VLRELLMRPSYRQMSLRLAESALCRKFCGIGEIERVRVPGKSRLQTYSTWLAPEAMREVLDGLLRSAGSELGAARIELNLVLMDSMAAAGRKPGGKKQKKALLRQMKTLSRTIAAHARRHRAALDEGWAQTGWTLDARPGRTDPRPHRWHD